MRLGEVIGRVTLSARHPSYVGERLMLTMPWTAKTVASAGEGKRSDLDFSIVVYDRLGASPGQTIAITEGGEGATAFEKPTPCDAYCAALIDEVYIPKTKKESTS
jgi:microcompartment protein CcmK/EutM